VVRRGTLPPLQKKELPPTKEKDGQVVAANPGGQQHSPILPPDSLLYPSLSASSLERPDSFL
jgi:hypothetical protein